MIVSFAFLFPFVVDYICVEIIRTIYDSLTTLLIILAAEPKFFVIKPEIDCFLELAVFIRTFSWGAVF